MMFGIRFDVIVMRTERFERTKRWIGGIAYPANKHGLVIYDAASSEPRAPALPKRRCLPSPPQVGHNPVPPQASQVSRSELRWTLRPEPWHVAHLPLSLSQPLSQSLHFPLLGGILLDSLRVLDWRDCAQYGSLIVGIVLAPVALSIQQIVGCG